MMTLGSRIARARQSRNWSQAKLAEKIGKSPATIGSWETGRTEPSRLDVARTALALGLPIGEIESFDLAEYSPANLLTVPVLAWVSAGAVSDIGSLSDAADHHMVIADLPPGDYFATHVRGDSMDRVSPEGSRIIVNIADKTLVPGGFYIFSLRGETTYKAFQRDPVLRLEPFSTNPANKTIFLNGDGWFVVGRVVRSYIDLA